ncbi:MAG: papain-like cysteine protease family protein [Pseudomonadota bacterium]
MSKNPAIHFNTNIRYDVPYVYMDSANDCWICALKMMHDFNVNGTFDTSDYSGFSRDFGAQFKQMDELLKKSLKPHKIDVTSADQIYHFLQKNGPALVVLMENGEILHAQILTGRYRGDVFLNNPDNDFAKADLSASGEFLKIEKSIQDRYGGISYEEWQREWQESADETPKPLDFGMSPETSPQPLRKDLSFATISRGQAPNSPTGSPPPVRSSSTAPQMFSGFSLPEGSPMSSPPRSPVLNRNSGSSSPVKKPSIPSNEMAQLMAALNKAKGFGESGSEQRRAYIADMEEQFLYRQHRPMRFSEFKGRLVSSAEGATLWTWPDW